MVGNLQNIFMEHDLNILMIFGIKEKWIILSHIMYCCLLLQIYLCYLWLLLCSRVTYIDRLIMTMTGKLQKHPKSIIQLIKLSPDQMHDWLLWCFYGVLSFLGLDSRGHPAKNDFLSLWVFFEKSQNLWN